MDGSRLRIIALVTLLTGACSGSESPIAARPSSAPRSESVPASPTPDAEEPGGAEERIDRWVTHRPKWLGSRVLSQGPSGFGIAKPTPPILRNRRFPTIDFFPRPTKRGFAAITRQVPKGVLNRSTWRAKCPVEPVELAYIKMPYWGFDHRRHTGEMLTNASVADDLIEVFHKLYRARFPIEEMRVVTLREQREWHTKPTGDTNVTSSFECRQATQGSTWSQHAYGFAIDINPFHNPYLNGDLVAPELAGAYLDRSWRRPGMVLEGDVVTRAFDTIGWGWGGRWSSTKDWMHFSQSGH